MTYIIFYTLAISNFVELYMMYVIDSVLSSDGYLLMQVEEFWVLVEKMPIRQRDWDASKKLLYEISQYREVLPLLKRLHSKVILNVPCTVHNSNTLFL